MEFTNRPPEWQNEGVEPPKATREEGFRAGYKPPASFFNWFWNLVGRCIKELQEKAKLTLVSATSIVEGGAHDVILKDASGNVIK